MNDRFKFRFYDKQFKMYLSDGHYINGNKWMDDYYEDVYDLPENIIPEQCTGLKDKNGNLIYEGDLIKSPSNSYPLEIVRMPNGVYGCKVCKIHPVWEMNLYSLINAYDVEIIGNIHEQAEQKEQQ